MDTKKVILQRSATRQFLNQPVSDQTLKAIMKVAQKSPSWIDAQENRVIIAKGALLDKMRKVHKIINDDPNRHTKSDVKYVPIRDWDPAAQKNMNAKIESAQELLGKARDIKLKNTHKDVLFNAPAVAYLTLSANYAPYALLDTGLLAQTIMLAAGNLGVASLPAFEFVKYPNYLRKFLNLPKQQKLILGIGLGYRDHNDPINKVHPKRMPLDQFMQIKK